MTKGEKYRHFKGAIVEILEIAKDSETLEDMVVYKHTDTNEVWVRPLSMFLSKVDARKYPDVKQEYRFEKIN
jgi:hypothetical protein